MAFLRLACQLDQWLPYDLKAEVSFAQSRNVYLRLSIRQLVIRYAMFAAIATVANLGVQRLVLSATSGWYIAALMSGTLVGLVVKYRLDKRWIFFDDRHGLRNETRTFSLYTLTGVGTTALFWGSETLFWLLGQTHTMREVGAVLGLTAGYVLKYNLDHKFVFNKTDDTHSRSLDSQSE